MEPIYWYIAAYCVGSAVGLYMGVVYGLKQSRNRAIEDTLCTLEAEHYIRTRIDANGSIQLIKLPHKYRTFKGG